MTDEIVTKDLTQFGFRELDMAADLLKAYANNKNNVDFSDGVNVFMNKNSGNVFLCDEDMRVGVLEGDEVVEFFSCPECGFEGTQYEAKDENKDFLGNEGYCSKECLDKNL